MFCKIRNGKTPCIKKDKNGNELERCGLLIKMERTLNNPVEGAGGKNTWDECAFTVLINNNERLVNRMLGVQQATEHARNQKNMDDGKMMEVVAHGLAGIMLAAANDPKAAESFKRMSSIIDEAKQLQAAGAEGKKLVETGKLPH